MKQIIEKKKLPIVLGLFLILFFYKPIAYCSVDQILNSNFFPNPAELSLTKQMQLVAGDVFINPNLKFSGTAYGNTGTAVSKTYNSLPYFLSAFRVTDRFVLGINATPSGYGHIQWPFDSIVINDSTTTKLIYYRIGVQGGYEFNEKLSIGAGLNLQYHKIGELDFVIPKMGNQINKISGYNYTIDGGLYYKINSHHFFTAAIYSEVHTLNRGSSTLGVTTVNNLYLTVAEAPVAYLGLQHNLTDKWYLEEKLYWSGWGMQKTLYFINTTTGSRASPTLWKDTFSIQVSNRYSILDKMALLFSVIYETNPGGPVFTNSIGYPLAPTGSISAGLDYMIFQNFSAQLIYGYGTFIPKAKINNPNDFGVVSANTHAFVLQFSYKV